MATNAADALGWQPHWNRLLGFLRADPERLEFTTRLALVCALTTLVDEIYQNPDIALTVYIAFFLNRRERTLSLILSIAFTIVVSVVIALTFGIAREVVDDPMWRVASIALVSFVLLFLGSASRLRPIAGTIALITAYALALLGTVQAGELATRALLYAWLFVAIPAAVTIVVNLALAPAPRRSAERAIAERLRVCAALLREPANGAAQRAFCTRADEGIGAILQNLKLAGMERSIPACDLAALKESALATAGLVSALEVLISTPGLQVSVDARFALAAALEEMAGILERGGYPVDVTCALPAGGGALASRLLGQVRELMTRFAEPARQAEKLKERGDGFFLKDAFTNPQHVQYALKTTGAAVFCYCLYSLLDWPGIHTCFLTCYIVAQTTAAESVEKLTLRICGCLIGAAAGYLAIIFLIPDLTSIGGLLLCVFVGAWFAAYLAAGSERISYAGFQMAFAFFLCVLQGPRAGFDLTVARDRVIGLLLGNCVAYVANVYVWPVSITRRIDPALAAALGLMRKLLLSRDRGEQLSIASNAHSALMAVKADLELARYEPRSIRASDVWLSKRDDAIVKARSLDDVLLLGSGDTDIPRSIIADRLEQLATEIGGGTLSGAPVAPSATDHSELSCLIERHLRALERALRSDGSGSSGHARP